MRKSVRRNEDRVIADPFANSFYARVLFTVSRLGGFHVANSVEVSLLRLSIGYNKSYR